MTENHPRWYELVGIHGSPLELVNYKKDVMNSKISSNSAKVVLKSCVKATEGKQLEKKLLLSMTIEKLKSICQKWFSVEMLKIKLVYRDEKTGIEFEINENMRDLHYFSVEDGGIIFVYDSTETKSMQKKVKV